MGQLKQPPQLERGQHLNHHAKRPDLVPPLNLLQKFTQPDRKAKKKRKDQDSPGTATLAANKRQTFRKAGQKASKKTGQKASRQRLGDNDISKDLLPAFIDDAHVCISNNADTSVGDSITDVPKAPTTAGESDKEPVADAEEATPTNPEVEEPVADTTKVTTTDVTGGAVIESNS